MNAFEYIFSKQVQWACNQGINLVGSKENRGRLAYTRNLEENLFEPLDPTVRKAFDEADGNELNKKDDSLPKMHAVHSSSALCVNVFQYWMRIREIPKIAAACGFCSRSNTRAQTLKFESKHQISPKFKLGPNIDVVIKNSSDSGCKVFAIESKFSEAYSKRGHSGVNAKYLKLQDVWEGIPNIRSLAESISPNDSKFTYLHPAQLIKHILALRKSEGKNGFRLLYLWYDVFGFEGATQQKEIKRFVEITNSDSVPFHALSYQELIIKLANEHRGEHEKYINYISGRYL